MTREDDVFLFQFEVDHKSLNWPNGLNQDVAQRLRQRQVDRGERLRELVIDEMFEEGKGLRVAERLLRSFGTSIAIFEYGLFCQMMEHGFRAVDDERRRLGIVKHNNEMAQRLREAGLTDTDSALYLTVRVLLPELKSDPTGFSAADRLLLMGIEEYGEGDPRFIGDSYACERYKELYGLLRESGLQPD